MSEDALPVRRRDVAIAAGITALVLALALLGDPEVRTNLVSQPAVRELLCDDEVLVDVTTNEPGRLPAPEGGIAVHVHRGEESLPASLELYRRDGGDWSFYWSLEAPSGREIFFISSVQPYTEAYVLAKLPDHGLCPAKSPILTAS